MKALAIDPGLANMGYAARIDGGLISGTVVTGAKEALHERLIKLTCGVPHREFDYLIIESCFGPAKTKLDYVIGTLIASVDHELFILASPARWKKTLCPKGNKETYGKKITRLVKKTFHRTPASQHEADALGLLYWFEVYGLKELANDSEL